jgi:cyclopropane-fatty-acyl-phospholipid synthase
MDNLEPYQQVLVIYGAWSLLSQTRLFDHVGRRLTLALSNWSEAGLRLVYKGLVPDFIIRWGIRQQLKGRLLELEKSDVETDLVSKMQIVEGLQNMPVAIETQAANEQHYEVPTEFYTECLGPLKKYSSGYWPSRETTFAESELHMLDLYCQRAGVKDGMKIVDLGCGWGSLTLYLASRYPNCQITGISNSHSQREYIMEQARVRGLKVDNIQIITVSYSNHVRIIAISAL